MQPGQGHKGGEGRECFPDSEIPELYAVFSCRQRAHGSVFEPLPQFAAAAITKLFCLQEWQVVGASRVVALHGKAARSAAAADEKRARDVGSGVQGKGKAGGAYLTGQKAKKAKYPGEIR